MITFQIFGKNLTKLRITAHTSLIEKGRYRSPKLPRNLRQCTLCTQIEDEERCILFYQRKTWFDQKNVFSKLNIDVATANSEMTSSIFTKLMNSDNKTDTKDVCNYIQLAFSTYHMVTW
jgi:hypothetical protein